jgi:hypothetical protein
MRPDPVTQFVADEDLVGFLGDIAEVIEDVAANMPDHGAFVRSLPASTEAAKTAAQPAASPQVSFTLRYERGETAA